MQKELKLLIAADLAFVIGSGLYGPIYAIFVEHIGGDLLDVGIAYFIFLITMATLEIPAGKMADKYGRKKFLAAGYLLLAFTIIGYIFITNKYQLFLIQMLGGVALAIADPAWEGWFSSHIDKKESSFDWGIYHATLSYGAAFSALLGGIIAKFAGFKLLFMLGGAIAITAFFITLGIKETKIAERTIVHIHRGHIKKRRLRKQ